MSNYSNADAFISIETQKTRTSGNQTLTAIRKAILGMAYLLLQDLKTASMFQASGDDENIAVKINAYGSSTYDYKYGGKANYALVASEDANGNYQKLEILGVCPVYLGVSRFILPIVALTLIGNGEMVFLLTVLH